MKIRLNNVRLAFPALFEAKTVNGEGDPAFSASFILA
ncbi:ssDNA-binding protein, partial [Acinetobacter baumannii]